MNFSASTSNLNEKIAEICDNCSSKFNLLRKKKKCYYCQFNYCRNCIKLCQRKNETNNTNKFFLFGNKNFLCCNKCILMSSPASTLEQLMKIEIKYLRSFLTNRQISLRGYNEKQELVQLILSYNGSNNENTNTHSSTNGYNTQRLSERPNFSNHRNDSPTNENSRFEDNLTGSSSRDSLDGSSGTSSPINANESSPQTSNASQPQASSDPNNKTNRRASISDIKSVKDCEELSIKQIKEILSFNFVDYRGCFEKSELVEKLKLLYASYTKNKKAENEINQQGKAKNNKSKGISSSQENLNESDLCKICMDNLIDCVLIDCGHMCSCVKCGKLLAECPICRQFVVRVVRVFKS